MNDCSTCKHNGWLTTGDVATCNVCDNNEYYEKDTEPEDTKEQPNETV